MSHAKCLPSIATLLIFSGIAAAQQPPMITAQPNTIYVSAEGKFESAPDTALLRFNISAQDKSTRGAYDRAARAADQIRQVLRGNSIDPKAAEFGFFALQPVYDYREPKPKIVAYRASADVTLKLNDFAKVGSLIEQLSQNDVTANQSLNYTLENMDAAKIRAVEDALRRARDEALAVARAGGRALGELSYASVDTTEQPRPIMPLANRSDESTGRRGAHRGVHTPEHQCHGARKRHVHAEVIHMALPYSRRVCISSERVLTSRRFLHVCLSRAGNARDDLQPQVFPSRACARGVGGRNGGKERQ